MSRQVAQRRFRMRNNRKPGRTRMAALASTNTGTTLTVVMPAYNEERLIAAAVGEIQCQVLDRVSGSNLIVVDDGSTDRTGETLDGLSASDSRISVIHQRNGGHGAAVVKGLDAATGEFVFLVDSDRQIPAEAFHLLWAECEGNDGAFGVRRNRQDPATRLVLTKAVRWAISVIFGTKIKDANAPFKVFRRSVWLEARSFIPLGTLAPSLMLAIFARNRGLRIPEVDVHHRERPHGKSTIRHWKLLKFCCRAFGQLLHFSKRIQRK